MLSETGQSSLNVSVPADATPSSSLPVLVYIHGGDFKVGSEDREVPSS